MALFIASSVAEEHGNKAAPGGPAYVRFDPIFIPLIEGSEVRRQLGITLMLELVADQNRSDVEARRKQLTDAFFRDLYSFFQSRAGARGRVDQNYLKQRLFKVAERVVGPHQVKEVLIEQFFERSL